MKREELKTTKRKNKSDCKGGISNEGRGDFKLGYYSTCDGSRDGEIDRLKRWYFCNYRGQRKKQKQLQWGTSSEDELHWLVFEREVVNLCAPTAIGWPKEFMWFFSVTAMILFYIYIYILSFMQLIWDQKPTFSTYSKVSSNNVLFCWK